MLIVLSVYAFGVVVGRPLKFLRNKTVSLEYRFAVEERFFVMMIVETTLNVKESIIYGLDVDTDPQIH